jgi:ribosomal protein S6--L-glutamate ligase
MRIGVLTEEPKNEDVAIALKEAGEKLGAEIVILDLNECAIVNSAKPEVLYQGKPIDGLDACLVRGSESKLEFRTHIVDYLTKKGVMMVNQSVAIVNCDNKFATQTLINSVGIKTPNTVAVVQIEQLDAAVQFIGDKFPMIVKTVSGSHGVGVIKVESYESMKSIVQYLLAEKTDLMVQEFIPHKESGRIMILGDRVIASVMRTIPDGDFRSNMDQGAELKPHTASPEETEVALKVAKTLGCVLSAIDYIVDPDGEMVIFEANSSPGLKGIQSVNEGVDIASEIIQFIMDLVGPASQPADVPVDPQTVASETSEEEEEVEKKKKKHPNYIPIAVPSNVQMAPNAARDKDEAEGTETSTDADDVASGGAEEEEEEASAVGLKESIIIKRINNDKPFEGKVDTGADRCSLHGSDIEVGDNYVRFLIDDTRYKVPLERFVTVLASNGSEKRPIVKFNVEFNGNTFEDIEFNISDRSDMKFPVIIGKNLLEVAGVMVNPSEEG